MSITRRRIVPTDELNQRNTQFGKFIPSWRCTSINSSAANRRCTACCLGLRCGSMSVSKEPAQVVPQRNLVIVSIRQRYDPLIVTQQLLQIRSVPGSAGAIWATGRRRPKVLYTTCTRRVHLFKSTRNQENLSGPARGRVCLTTTKIKNKTRD